ncbi:hypothetical protein R3X28_15240 [Maribacter sp. TH_r10]|uniref:hypothetical protein n=1 Tax=Maribacter sp. TH_r10 TaxID=3082086 RepID=UPI002954B005|nr:hypothetical protein [Maribacter sp. TH_r10]MDV7140244.1 hypothetical protein [Maribacter sp. TH_r10]
MNYMGRLFNFYLDASIHVAFAVVSLCMATSFLFNVQLESHLFYFVFFGTIINYNFIKYGIEAKKYILVGNRYHKNIQFFSFICFIMACYHGWFLSADTWLILFILAIFTGLYALPVLPRARNLRSLGGLKIFIVALVWSGITVVLPLVEIKMVLGWDVWVEVVQRILLVLVLLIPFEIRDLAYDQPELRTIPQRMGVTRTKVFGAFLVVMFFGLTYLKDLITEIELIAKGVLFLVLGGLMFVTKRNQSIYFSSFWVEAVPLIWCGFIWVLVYLF